MLKITNGSQKLFAKFLQKLGRILFKTAIQDAGIETTFINDSINLN